MLNLIAQIATPTPQQTDTELLHILIQELSKGGSAYIFLSIIICFFILTIPALISGISILFYLYRGLYNARIEDRDDFINRNEKFQVDLMSLKLRNLEVLEGLKKSLDANNSANDKLIEVLNRSLSDNLQKKIKDLEAEKANKKEGDK
jgi:hypothetical protein